ncbi:unnamed protein product [Vicia faba]|uniref:Uncharacterized protein n=1 Tax=Vicia faba TaxID=3906 RepID=A0AAV1B3R8_VICFA|nr:unnamed protein product [Vicia faba]
MSGSSDEEISNGNREGYQRGGSDGDDDEDEEEDRKKKKNRARVDFGYGKRLVLRQFTNAKNQIRRVRSRKVVIVHGDANPNGFGCKFCFSRPSVIENSDGSPSSDPNDPKFTHSMMKSLIEKNDFSSKECNPHIELLNE